MWNKILPALIIGGIILSFFVAHADSKSRDRTQREQVLSGCIRGSVRPALDAAGWLRAAEARRADGNKNAAAYYTGIADGLVLTIAAPHSIGPSRSLVQVQSKTIDSKSRYVLTPTAKALQRKGCEEAYPKP